jgi:acetylornithine deacetylase/succinyl-diaminopimelate desuccinylase-like protein
MSDPGARALAHCKALLRLDTSNPGGSEEPAVRYVEEVLSAAGVDTGEVVEPEPGRCSLVARVPGADPALPALLVHGHLDVVPAGEGWTHDPFGAVEADGCIWGRGAADMKSLVGMMLAAHEELAARAARGDPATRRTLVFAYLADEEMGGRLGSSWIADRRPDLLDGVTQAVGEGGGFSLALPNGRRVYPIVCAEHALLWVRITLGGPGGHAALADVANPVTRMGRLIDEIADLRLPDDTPPPAHLRLVAELQKLAPTGAGDPLKLLGSFGEMARLCERTRFVPTVARAGTKVNVVPQTAELTVDCRHAPGRADAALAALQALLEPGEALEVIAQTPGMPEPRDQALEEAAAASLHAADPDAVVVPFAMAAGSDVQNLSRVGLEGIGFMPLPLPLGFDYPAMFHVPDERLPVDSLSTGTRVFLDFLSKW